MFLINARTMKLESFMDESSMPRYAILSHTWGPEEVSMQEFESLDQNTRRKAGYLKIRKTCELAINTYGLGYAWVDTCCIDKKSSAELSEAINSMFRWYAEAKICIAFLEDLTVDPLTPYGNESTAFEQCRWFSRGWCLQELIAPSDRALSFYDSSWRDIGTREVWAIFIHRRSGIDRNLLQGDATLQEFSVAQRMSWAANRQTTRVEDRAYSLLGVFGVNMPLLYGEGPRAFLRLQEEIIKDSQDISIFAWRRTPDEQGPDTTGLFATSPDDFALAGRVVVPRRNLLRNDVALDNKGVRFQHGILHRDIRQDAHWILMLDVFTLSPVSYLGIYLHQVAPDMFVRIRPTELKVFDNKAMHGYLVPFHGTKNWLDWFEDRAVCNYTLYVPKTISRNIDFFEVAASGGLAIIPRTHSLIRSFRVLEVHPGPRWMSFNRTFLTFGQRFVGYIELRLEADEQETQPITIACGVQDGGFWCHISMQSDQITPSVKKWISMYNNNELNSSTFMARITPYKNHVVSLIGMDSRTKYVVSAYMNPVQGQVKISLDKDADMRLKSTPGLMTSQEGNQYYSKQYTGYYIPEQEDWEGDRG